MSTNSILGTKLLYGAGAKSDEVDIYGNTPIKYALYSGRFEIYNFFNEKIIKQEDLNLKNKIDSLKLKSISGDCKLIEDEELIENYQNIYEELINFFEKNKIENVNSLLKNNFQNIKLNEEQIYNLIEISCKNRNLKLLKILL